MIIELNRINKSYKNNPHVLKNITINIKEGEKVIIVGESGAGKTSLLNVIGLIDNEFNGDYRLMGNNIKLITPKEKAKVLNKTFGFVFQEYALIEDETVYSNVKVPLLYSTIKKKDYRRKIEKVLSEVGLSEEINNKVNELSGGQRQRVAIARALVNEPQVILADEPTGSLDSNTTDQIMDIIYKYVNENKTLILITHDLYKIKRVKQRIITLQHGLIISDKME